MMKAKLTAIMLLMSLGLFAQGDITSKISSYLSEGQSEKISAHFAASVDMTIGEEEDMYANDQAAKMLSRFFSQHKVSAFDMKHKGTSKLNDHYRIGQLQTDKGEFRVTYFMKDQGGKFIITQFRIEESED